MFAGTLKTGGSDIFTSREEIANLTNSGSLGRTAINDRGVVAFVGRPVGALDGIYSEIGNYMGRLGRRG